MKFWFLFLLLFSVSNCSVKEDKPELAVANSNINLGQIKYDSTTVIQFKIYNKGYHNLIIDTVSASCDCTVPDFVKKTISSSDSTILLVRYTPANLGEFKKVVVLRSNTDSVFTILKFYGKAIK